MALIDKEAWIHEATENRITVMGGNSQKNAIDLEGLCRCCGLCCHEKIRFGEQVVITDIPCEFLDTETNLCTVYPERFAKQPRCSSAEDSVKANGLPGDCPYVGGRAGYQEPHLLWEHPEYENAVNTLYPDRKKKTGR